MPGYEALIWLGIVAPKGTPDAVVRRLNQVVGGIASSEEVRAAWGKDGAQPMVMSPAAFRDYLATDITKWAQVVKLSGATAGQ